MRKLAPVAMMLMLSTVVFNMFVFDGARAEPRGPFTPVNYSQSGLQTWGLFGPPSGPAVTLPRRESAPERRIQVAGRCGSSNFYCNSPGATYCCGTPGNYYCAKDVNGCTR
jgi:hypothetical protein